MSWHAVILVVALFCWSLCVPSGFAHADAAHSAVAPADARSQADGPLLEGMSPITADEVVSGTYDIEVASSSPYFKVKRAELTVEGGRMSAAIHLDSTSYPLVFMGSAEQAAAAPADDYITFNKDSRTFDVPVEALDAEIPCAAFSKRRAMWYDRMLVFHAASLPEGALLVDVPEYGEPVSRADGADSLAPDGSAGEDGADDAGAAEAVAVDLPDGEYSIEVNMTGGSGRASVSSPTWLVVEGGRAFARLLWSSPYYDYMIVGGVRYDNMTDDGSNSTFVVPITAVDDEMDVIADTTAMGDPVEIEYHLTFYSGTIADKDAIPQEAAVKVLYIAIAVIVVGGVLNWAVKRRRKR